MEAIAIALEPYKDLVGAAAGIVTTGQMFSGSFMCWDFYKRKSTGGMTIMPFIGGLVMSLLNLKFGFILRDDTMIRVNFLGIALNIIYLMIYFNYSQEKMKVWALVGGGGAVSAAVFKYVDSIDSSVAEQHLGFIITALMFYLIASPLLELGEIIKKKSTEGLPFPIIFSGTLVTFMWLLYGIVIRNQFLVVQNIVAFALCSFQLSLFVIYPSKGTKGSKGKPKAKKTN